MGIDRQQWLTDHVPLQEGLRPGILLTYLLMIELSQTTYHYKKDCDTNRLAQASRSAGLTDHVPLQEGLRPPPQELPLLLRWLTDHVPLQEGLRRLPVTVRIHHHVLTDHVPLQEGLRPLNWTGAADKLFDSQTTYHYKKDCDQWFMKRLVIY